MDVCDNCGTAVNGHGESCPDCGAPLAEQDTNVTPDPSAPVTPERTTSRRSVLKYGGGLVALLGGGGFALGEIFGPPDPKKTIRAAFEAATDGDRDAVETFVHPGISDQKQLSLVYPLISMRNRTLEGVSVKQQRSLRAIVSVRLSGTVVTGERSTGSYEYDLRLVDGEWKLYDILSSDVPESPMGSNFGGNN